MYVNEEYLNYFHMTCSVYVEDPWIPVECHQPVSDGEYLVPVGFSFSVRLGLFSSIFSLENSKNHKKPCWECKEPDNYRNSVFD